MCTVDITNVCNYRAGKIKESGSLAKRFVAHCFVLRIESLCNVNFALCAVRFTLCALHCALCSFASVTLADRKSVGRERV